LFFTYSRLIALNNETKAIGILATGWKEKWEQKIWSYSKELASKLLFVRVLSFAFGMICITATTAAALTIAVRVLLSAFVLLGADDVRLPSPPAAHHPHCGR
jgi:hypothetical protein